MAQEPYTVLVAEDNYVLGDILRFNLEANGFQVILARTGDAAARHVTSEPFDLLVTDVEMPGMSGIELCRLVREQPSSKSIPIIICSARGLELDMNALTNGYRISSIIFKPFSFRDLLSKIERYLDA